MRTDNFKTEWIRKEALYDAISLVSFASDIMTLGSKKLTEEAIINFAKSYGIDLAKEAGLEILTYIDEIAPHDTSFNDSINNIVSLILGTYTNIGVYLISPKIEKLFVTSSYYPICLGIAKNSEIRAQFISLSEINRVASLVFNKANFVMNEGNHLTDSSVLQMAKAYHKNTYGVGYYPYTIKGDDRVINTYIIKL